MQRLTSKSHYYHSIIHRINELIEVEIEDPDVQRRSKLLNIVLLGIFTVAVLAAGIIVYSQAAGILPLGDVSTAYVAIVIVLGLIIITYLINRLFSSQLAASIFLVFLTIITYFSNTPYETLWGQNMILLALPIITSSVILRPVTSFITATGLGVFLLIVAATQSISPNIVGILTYYAIAFIAWLSANTMENALQHLRVLNQELDNRVSDRTKELQIANAELLQARDKAVEASMYKSELTARASHELRTPLGSIIGFAEMLRGGHFGEVNNRQKERLTKIVSVTKHLTNLINNWLDQAQLESGKLKLHLEGFSPRELSHSIEDTMQVLANNKALKLTCTVQKNIPAYLYGDQERIQQIMVNLIGNAIKYTERGAITASLFQFDEVHWAIQVTDTGCGISEDALPLIFDSFQQADGSRTRRFEGFGLGLSIVKQLVELMNGDIDVTSEVNKGSTFTVILPLLPVPTKSMERI
ncbi:MAG: hypothetical protein KC419_00170 [Anaerolineales bacterium]|nr:hypothetical protein [Anaerolineales bacterium]MCA9926848.1 hypothetical protein [Anaerolineales bacterium]